MKKLKVFLMILSGFTGMVEAVDSGLNLRIDSIYIYNWNDIDSLWVNPDVSKYYYDIQTQKLLEIMTENVSSRIPISKQVIEYDENGLASGTISYAWNQNEWIPSSRNLNMYYPDGKLYSVVIQGWNGSGWINLRKQDNYQYDNNGNLIQWTAQRWIDETWKTVATDHWIYNEENQLIRRLNILTSGAENYQIIYNYNEFGNYSEMYAQSWFKNEWTNWWKQIYDYDNCGNRVSMIRQNGNYENWINTKNSVYYLSYNYLADNNKKIPVCHKGRTIYVSTHALKAHLAHGDCLGNCLEHNNNHPGNLKSSVINNTENLNTNQIKIYPNPAYDNLNIKLEKENTFTRIQLIHYTGIIVKDFEINNSEEIVIPREELASGIYLLRLIGTNIETFKIIYK